MNQKKKFFQVMELYINKSKRVDLENYYGEGSKIEIKSITTSQTSNKCLIEAKVILGDKINEEYLYNEFADILVRKSFHIFYPEFIVNTMVTFES